LKDGRRKTEDGSSDLIPRLGRASLPAGRQGVGSEKTEDRRRKVNDDGN
jgi:hypothetical protein